MLIAVTLSTEAIASAVVLRSNARAYPPGRVIETGAEIRLRSQQSIELLSHGGEVMPFSGPLRQRLNDAQQPDSSVWNAFGAMFRARKEQVRLGGVRGQGVEVGERCAAPPQADNWRDIAADWDAGCKDRALDRLEARLRPAK